VLDELARLKVFQINIGGGEPLLRPDIFSILNYANKLGIVSCLSTNGTTLKSETCQRLAEIEGLYVQVSLDGVEDGTNDVIRGKGTYVKIRQGMEALAHHGVGFSINAVLTALNFPQIDELKRLAGEFGGSLRVSRFRPSGRGKDCRVELAPSRDQLEDFAEWLACDPDILTGDSFFSLTSERRRRMGLDMCGAAKMTCCLSPNGNLYPCAFLQEMDFLAGNIRQTSLEWVWHHSRIFAALRKLEATSCMSCSRFESCRGGCPAMAYFTYGDLGFPDPECVHNILKTA
jgi:mycofactocin radical SAM maturase